MTQRTVLVTGATGLLGREVAKAFRARGWSVKGTGFSRADGVDVLKVDLGDKEAVAKVLDEVNKKGAAERFPDKVEKNPEGARALNIEASRSLANLAAERKALLVYISTDYVFPGVEGEAPYEADATPRPTNLYGQTKRDGEVAVLDEYAAGSVVLRVPVLYGHAESASESAVNTLMDSLWKSQAPGAEVKMDHWSLRYPTCTEDVGRVCHDVAVKYLDTAGPQQKELPRILQFSSEDRMTKYEICQKFAAVLGLKTEGTGLVANTEGNDPNASVQRPYDCHLSTKALKDLGIDVSTVGFDDWWGREAHVYRR
ncbi:Nucleoside-diphosphate-sugar epimerase [Geosmithia morbida]|uniref:Nucleoside-diphosphate-sugar epimerase n=1 Tax=Geosmithia morbida TaxID=1094350 RepID=A0A9P5D247_9HYPO|nr:Nucleoside-diphosphate-sugar epimerase [Geosmithia morbida]KAF4120455.1 Nucleoside-diphosphate-sugar epimerase [Geosmithia morbida]